MKRGWRSFVWILLGILAAGVALDSVWKWHSTKMRQAAYLTALNSFSARLKPGTSRKNVEEVLRSQGLAFQQRGAEVDLILIGKEKPDWVCSEKNEYLEFHFVPAPTGEAWKAEDADKLTRITPLFEGTCL